MRGHFIGLDVGTKRTGLSRGTAMARLAEPLSVVPTEEVIVKLGSLMEEQPIEGIVIGLPRGMQGQDTEQTRWVRQWVKAAKPHLPVTFYWQDESLTSKLAIERRPKSLHIDAEAATIILQDFLDAKEEERLIA